MINRIIKTYPTSNGPIDVVACWDGDDVGHPDFYDLFDAVGECQNLGEPFYSLPTLHEVTRFLNEIA
jgi:hypothetical protein